MTGRVAEVTGASRGVLADEYGFTDVDGSRPESIRPHFADRSTADPAS
jgi:hypothetical protein